MPDMEKVIVGIEHCDRLGCSMCPYKPGGYTPMDCRIQLMRDAFALLKEQQEQIDKLLEESASNAEMAEGLKELLKEQETKSTVESRLFHCEKCGYGIDDIYLSNEHDFDVYPHYCPNCGRKVKWE